ncbi:MAG: metallophosphoesterase, partial [Candidatus Bathyarchaeota archaeon]|nr:metallophosphoesterase [Candidatus Bathyarchaeota archaeon]
VGNHEDSQSDMAWIRAHYPSLPWIVNSGPPGCETTTYSFDYLNAHFVVLNEYYKDGEDMKGDGDVPDEIYDWLVADLAATTKPAVFVFGHEPAFPFTRHVGDSLDGYPANRDRFWNLLEQELVVAYLCGHTHYYSKYQHDAENVWQIDLGNAGNTDGDLYTFLDVTVDESKVQFDIWRGAIGAYSLTERWTVYIETPRVSKMISGPASGARISEGGSITVSGSISPALSDETVALTYTRPDDTTFVRTVTTGSNGLYSDSYQPDVTGSWEVTASWVVDGEHEAKVLVSFDVLPSNPWTNLIGGIAVGAIAIIAVIIVLKRRQTAA